MNIRGFLRQHYSTAAGESPVGHAATILAGLALVIIGIGLIASVAFAPIGTTTMVLGLLILAGGLFAHIQSPLSVKDLVDTVIGLSGAAIAATFAIVVAAMVIGFGATLVVSFFRALSQ
jgi:hypothetical protein